MCVEAARRLRGADVKIVTTLTVPVFTMGVAGLSAPSEWLTFPRAAASCYMLILIAVSLARGEGTSSSG